MSEPGKAVFLSYASQDAEAAKRICDALRGAGVEVWFDAEGGLEHGDEWDAKIRRQIKECVLFLPIISANTQARHEGYFRIEWDLAAERARGIASGVPFILPVVIDDTREPDALVPDRFRMVQWTRLRGGEVPPEVLQRFLKLWSHRAGVLRHEAAMAAEVEVGTSLDDGGSAPPQKRGLIAAAIRRSSHWRWTTAGVIGVIALSLAIWKPWDRGAKSGAPAMVPRSGAQALNEKAWAQLNQPGRYRTELEIADDLCRRAAAADPDSADAWAAWSQVHTWYVYYGIDQSAQRREAARAAAARAVQLDPKSFEARLAQACYLVRTARNAAAAGITNDEARSAEPLLRALLGERPNEPRACFALAILLRNLGRDDEAVQFFDAMAAASAFTVEAWTEKAWLLWGRGRFAEAQALCDRALAQQAFSGDLLLRIYLCLTWTGDLDLAKATVESLPPTLRQDEKFASFAVRVYWWRREPQVMLRALDTIPQPWITWWNYPKSFYTGQARLLAGEVEAAQVSWQEALRQVEVRARDEPENAWLVVWKAELLGLLGRKAEADSAMRLARGFGTPAGTATFSLVGDWSVALATGDRETALKSLEKGYAKTTDQWPTTWAILRFNPQFDPLRNEPRFQALLARAEADPARCPHARRPTADAANPGAGQPDPKSVVVLPFANLSGDPAQEYFSDGLTEEILNALARERDLRVVPRTSAFSFKGKNLPLPEIARALNVAQVVEGSVQRAGSHVRIRCTLTRIADGFAEALPAFDRELKAGADIFALEDEVATAVLEKLTRRTASTAPVAVLTKNSDAYDAYLRGRDLMNQTSPSWPHAVEAFRRAVELDPQFALAWANLGQLSASLYAYGFDGAALAASGRAIDEAVRLQPDLPEAHLARAFYLRASSAPPAAVEHELARAESMRPDVPEIVEFRASLEFARGDEEPGLKLMQRAVDLDPRNGATLNQLGNELTSTGRYAEAEEIYQRSFQILGSSIPLTNRARIYFLWKGDRALAARTLDEAPEEIRGDRYWTSRALLLHAIGDQTGALAAAAHMRPRSEFFRIRAFFTARMHEAMGDAAGAQRDYLAALPLAEQQRDEFPAAPEPWAILGLIDAGLGRKAEALAAVQRAVGGIQPPAAPVLNRSSLPRTGLAALTFVDSELDPFAALAQIQARFGMTDEALAIVKEAVAAGRWRRNYLLLSPDWAVLRKDPRFREIAEKAPL